MIVNKPTPRFPDDFEKVKRTKHSGYHIYKIFRDFSRIKTLNTYLRFGYAGKKCAVCNNKFEPMELHVMVQGYYSQQVHPRCYIESMRKEIDCLERCLNE